MARDPLVIGWHAADKGEAVVWVEYQQFREREFFPTGDGDPQKFLYTGSTGPLWLVSAERPQCDSIRDTIFLRGANRNGDHIWLVIPINVVVERLLPAVREYNKHRLAITYPPSTTTWVRIPGANYSDD